MTRHWYGQDCVDVRGGVVWAYVAGQWYRLVYSDTRVWAVC